VPVVTHTTNTLIPKKKSKLGTQTPTVSQSRPTTGAAKSDKKRISPVLLQSDAQAAANNPASSKNNIRNILGPTVISPKASDVSLLDTRMASASGKEVSVVPETTNSATLKPASALSQSDKSGSTGSANDAPSKPSKMEVKKNGLDGASLKRKRESDRAPVPATAIVAKAREVVARAPRLLNERFVLRVMSVDHKRLYCGADYDAMLDICHRSSAGVASGGQLLPEFPFRLQFSVEIDTSTRSSSSSASSNGNARDGLTSSKAVVEVTVHNLKSPQPEEIIGACVSLHAHEVGLL
jgi:hypothetical protein